MAARLISEVVARRFTLLAAGLSVCAGLVTAAAVVLGDSGFGLSNLPDVGLFLGLAYGVYRKSRTWAVVLFTYHLGNRLTMYQQTGSLGVSVGIAPTVYAVVFFLGILGAFSHHAIVTDRGELQESSMATRRWFTLLAAGLAVYSGLTTAIAIITGSLDFDLFQLVDVALFAGLAYGLYRNSRAAAIILFAYHLFNRFDMYERTSDLGFAFGFFPIAFAVVYFLGILGSFAHHAIVAGRRKSQES